MKILNTYWITLIILSTHFAVSNSFNKYNDYRTNDLENRKWSHDMDFWVKRNEYDIAPFKMEILKKMFMSEKKSTNTTEANYNTSSSTKKPNKRKKYKTTKCHTKVSTSTTETVQTSRSKDTCRTSTTTCEAITTEESVASCNALYLTSDMAIQTTTDKTSTKKTTSTESVRTSKSHSKDSGSTSSTNCETTTDESIASCALYSTSDTTTSCTHTTTDRTNRKTTTITDSTNNCFPTEKTKRRKSSTREHRDKGWKKIKNIGLKLFKNTEILEDIEHTTPIGYKYSASEDYTNTDSDLTHSDIISYSIPNNNLRNKSNSYDTNDNIHDNLLEVSLLNEQKNNSQHTEINNLAFTPLLQDVNGQNRLLSYSVYGTNNDSNERPSEQIETDENLNKLAVTNVYKLPLQNVYTNRQMPPENSVEHELFKEKVMTKQTDIEINSEDELGFMKVTDSILKIGPNKHFRFGSRIKDNIESKLNNMYEKRYPSGENSQKLFGEKVEQQNIEESNASTDYNTEVLDIMKPATEPYNLGSSNLYTLLYKDNIVESMKYLEKFGNHINKDHNNNKHGTESEQETKSDSTTEEQHDFKDSRKGNDNNNQKPEKIFNAGQLESVNHTPLIMPNVNHNKIDSYIPQKFGTLEKDTVTDNLEIINNSKEEVPDFVTPNFNKIMLEHQTDHNPELKFRTFDEELITNFGHSFESSSSNHHVKPDFNNNKMEHWNDNNSELTERIMVEEDKSTCAEDYDLRETPLESSIGNPEAELYTKPGELLIKSNKPNKLKQWNDHSSMTTTYDEEEISDDVPATKLHSLWRNRLDAMKKYSETQEEDEDVYYSTNHNRHSNTKYPSSHIITDSENIPLNRSTKFNLNMFENNFGNSLQTENSSYLKYPSLNDPHKRIFYGVNSPSDETSYTLYPFGDTQFGGRSSTYFSSNHKELKEEGHRLKGMLPNLHYVKQFSSNPDNPMKNSTTESSFTIFDNIETSEDNFAITAFESDEDQSEETTDSSDEPNEFSTTLDYGQKTDEEILKISDNLPEISTKPQVSPNLWFYSMHRFENFGLPSNDNNWPNNKEDFSKNLLSTSNYNKFNIPSRDFFRISGSIDNESTNDIKNVNYVSKKWAMQESTNSFDNFKFENKKTVEKMGNDITTPSDFNDGENKILIKQNNNILERINEHRNKQNKTENIQNCLVEDNGSLERTKSTFKVEIHQQSTNNFEIAQDNKYIPPNSNFSNSLEILKRVYEPKNNNYFSLAYLSSTDGYQFNKHATDFTLPESFARSIINQTDIFMNNDLTSQTLNRNWLFNFLKNEFQFKDNSGNLSRHLDINGMNSFGLSPLIHNINISDKHTAEQPNLSRNADENYGKNKSGESLDRSFLNNEFVTVRNNKFRTTEGSIDAEVNAFRSGRREHNFDLVNNSPNRWYSYNNQSQPRKLLQDQKLLKNSNASTRSFSRPFSSDLRQRMKKFNSLWKAINLFNSDYNFNRDFPQYLSDTIIHHSIKHDGYTSGKSGPLFHPPITSDKFDKYQIPKYLKHTYNIPAVVQNKLVKYISTQKTAFELIENPLGNPNERLNEASRLDSQFQTPAITNSLQPEYQSNIFRSLFGAPITGNLWNMPYFWNSEGKINNTRANNDLGKLFDFGATDIHSVKSIHDPFNNSSPDSSSLRNDSHNGNPFSTFQISLVKVIHDLPFNISDQIENDNSQDQYLEAKQLNKDYFVTNTTKNDILQKAKGNFVVSDRSNDVIYTLRPFLSDNIISSELKEIEDDGIQMVDSKKNQEHMQYFKEIIDDKNNRVSKIPQLNSHYKTISHEKIEKDLRPSSGIAKQIQEDSSPMKIRNDKVPGKSSSDFPLKSKWKSEIQSVIDFNRIINASQEYENKIKGQTQNELSYIVNTNLKHLDIDQQALVKYLTKPNNDISNHENKPLMKKVHIYIKKRNADKKKNIDKKMKSRELEYILEKNLPSLPLKKDEFIHFMMTGIKKNKMNNDKSNSEADVEKKQYSKSHLQYMIDKNVRKSSHKNKLAKKLTRGEKAEEVSQINT